MPFPYLGSETRTYTQWLDASTGRTLVADPGRSYDMYPAGGLNLTAPPADGLWEVPESGAKKDKAPDPAGTQPGAARTASTGTASDSGKAA